MKISILDDWFDTLRTLPSFSKLAGHEVEIWKDHVEDLDVLASRLAQTQVLVLIRERTAIREPLIERRRACALSASAASIRTSTSRRARAAASSSPPTSILARLPMRPPS